jgi:hypothetical protein
MNSPLIPSLRLELQQYRHSGHFGIEPLTTRVEWMRYCVVCESEQCFVAHERCANGLICSCSKCGDKRVVSFTRTNGHAVKWEAYT